MIALLEEGGRVSDGGSAEADGDESSTEAPGREGMLRAEGAEVEDCCSAW